MRSRPFHRRILPWIFTIVFICVAPALVFYTAGYRWNPKKGQIDRYGTVIIDSVPSGASIQIDGRPYTSATPVTIQNMAPGLHRFDVSKSGYFPWGKSLDVYPEHVTFANEIQLWKQSTPTLLTSLAPGKISLSTDARHLLYISNTTPTRMIAIDTRNNAQKNLSATSDLRAAHVLWSPNGKYALVEAARPSAASWLLDTDGTQQPLQLPNGQYRWQGSQLVGNDGRSLLSINLSDFSLSQTPLAARRVDQLDTDLLISPSSTNGIAYVDGRSPGEGFVLPSQNWTFWSTQNTNVLLRDGFSWLSLVKNDTGLAYHSASGDMLRQDPSIKSGRYLLVNGNELWLWDPLIDPQLLLRKSDPIIEAEWHHLGATVFYATAKDVIALNLDDRDGRMETALASFDSVYDLAVVGKQLDILATKNGSTGLWSLSIE